LSGIGVRRIPTQPEISEILAKVPEFCSRSENSVSNYQIHEELQRKANKVKQQLAKRRLRSWPVATQVAKSFKVFPYSRIAILESTTIFAPGVIL
jgi:hypothetical protein